MGLSGIRAGYPLSERQQVALLMQMTAEESANSPGMGQLEWGWRPCGGTLGGLVRVLLFRDLRNIQWGASSQAPLAFGICC